MTKYLLAGKDSGEELLPQTGQVKKECTEVKGRERIPREKGQIVGKKQCKIEMLSMQGSRQTSGQTVVLEFFNNGLCIQHVFLEEKKRRRKEPFVSFQA